MSEVLIDYPSDGVARVTLNRPTVKNALNLSIRQELASIFNSLSVDEKIRCIVLTGGDEFFAAGADIKEMAGRGAVEMMLRNIHLLWQAISSCPKPVIAAVNGYAWGGGCELAMHADIIIAGENASFCQPEVKVGIMPGAGGTQRLTRAIGKFQAMKMILTGKAVFGRDALAMGLCSDVLPDGEVQAAAVKMAETIAAMPPLAVAQIKEVVLAGQDIPLEAALMLERKAFQLLFDSKDQKEGMNAFLEKRKPVYQGR
jgi:enoyl-CoA hydratase/carnithine racemase